MDLESYFSVSQQTQVFLLACALGGFLSIPFEILRAVRMVILHKKAVVFIEDVLFCIFFGFCVFTFSVEVARGEIRGFVFFGAVLGFILFSLSFGSAFTFIFAKVIQVLQKFGVKVKKYVKNSLKSKEVIGETDEIKKTLEKSEKKVYN